MKYVALLRAVNVGGRSLKMAALVKTFKRLGFKDVRSFIASGNVLFSTGIKNETSLAKKIEKAIADDFKMEVPVLLRSQKELTALVKKIPKAWINDQEWKCDVMFLWDHIDTKSVLKEFPWNPKLEELRYVPGAILWRIDRKYAGKSRMFKIVGTKLHKSLTVRNPNTVRKIYALMRESK